MLTLNEAYYLHQKHMDKLKERISDVETAENIDILCEMIKIYQDIPIDERSKHLLHWFHDKKEYEHFELTPLRRVKSDEYEEYIYYDFIDFLLEKRKKRRRVVDEWTPRKKQCMDNKIHLVKCNSIDALFQESDRLPAHYFKANQLTSDAYKMCFALEPAVAKFENITNSTIQFIDTGKTHEVRIIASNCLIKIGNKKLFKYMTIQLKDVDVDINFDVDYFCDNSRNSIDLLDYVGVDQPCCIIFEAEVTFQFNTTPGQFHIETNARFSFDMDSCQMAYWSNSPIYAPMKYVVEDSKFLENMYHFSKTMNRLEYTPLPDYFKTYSHGFASVMRRYDQLRRIKAYWLDGKSMPYFRLDDQLLMITFNNETGYTLYYNRYSLATFKFDAAQNELSLSLIYPMMSKVINIIDYYVY
jgi:hypothetical protein